MNLNYKGRSYASVTKNITLAPHTLSAYYYPSKASGSQAELELNKINMVAPGSLIMICFRSPIENFEWMGNGLSFDDIYIPSTNVFRFRTPSGPLLDIWFRFTYKLKGCPDYHEAEYKFEIGSPYARAYNVTYSQSSDIIQIEPIEQQADTRTSDPYVLVSATDGSIKKQGNLSPQKINEIDVSNYSKGIYILNITSGENTNSTKISIK